jgi:hypothetical protein
MNNRLSGSISIAVGIALVSLVRVAPAGDTCAQYGYSGRPTNAAWCRSQGEQRTIQCLPGYYATPPASPSVTLTGSAPFGGCFEINECTLYGYSGKSDGVLSCVNQINARTITCQAGYFARQSPSGTASDEDLKRRSISVPAAAAFQGCAVIPMCRLYGFSGRSANTQSCADGYPNKRIITCRPGYAAIPPATDAVALLGDAPFNGCTPIDECAVYGYSGKPQHTLSCVDGNNSRTVRCASDYGPVFPYPNNNRVAPAGRDGITLLGSEPFRGCIPIPG